MKILLISNDQMTASRINRYFTPGGYGFIHYTNPLKAMDNFNEIRPDVVLFHESEYPRHWKLSVKSLREQFSRDSAVFILLVDSLFGDEDVHKAHFLGVNGFLPVDAPMESLESMILRYKVAPEVRKSHRLFPVGDHSLDFMFMNPSNLQLINSHILELSVNGAVLKIEELYKTAGLVEGTVLKNCSLKTHEGIVNLNVRIEHTGVIFEIVFLDGSENWQTYVQESIKALL
ncbi:hypothetical protein EXM22_05485 [Oceanispirochaeta crateris]|uniref:Response regulatory domain-containing protein n=1 Tax=Oceanispirochaeta crateris TaxID=2518645 RepID=A0A5C1QJI3_9SPIO|nr:hypothetical protein [Oceanispirochaeta crateris]QEN07468.1 hypothetical protein EXM22_05485 [Oceanispirochaeta crateris]